MNVLEWIIVILAVAVLIIFVTRIILYGIASAQYNSWEKRKDKKDGKNHDKNNE